MKHILLIEDERDIAMMLRQALEEEGYYVTFVSRLADAHTVTARMKFDLTISNILLPDGIAIDFMDAARQRNHPSFLMTGSVDHMAQLEAVGQHYLAKPFRLQDFLSLVHQRIGSERETSDAPQHQP